MLQLFIFLFLISYFFQASDILAIHEAKCPNPSRCVQISCDGLSECKSNSNSIDVYSIRFDKCNTVYPHTMTRPVDKYKLNPKQYFTYFIQDLCDHSYTIKLFVGDNPKRALAREALNHASLYACEYCFHKATSHEIKNHELEKKRKKLEAQLFTIEERITNLHDQEEMDTEELDTLNSMRSFVMTSLCELKKGKKKVVWPSSSQNGEPRTQAKIEAIIELMKEKGKLTQDEAKGIVGESPLLKIPNLDIVRDCPGEYLHSTCLGVVKRLVELTFNVGEVRQRITKRKLSSVASFNEVIIKIKLPMESSRRTLLCGKVKSSAILSSSSSQ